MLDVARVCADEGFCRTSVSFGCIVDAICVACSHTSSVLRKLVKKRILHCDDSQILVWFTDSCDCVRNP